jgi:hypothetical protein
LSHSVGLPSLSRRYSGHPGFPDTMWSQVSPRSSQRLAQTRLGDYFAHHMSLGTF